MKELHTQIMHKVFFVKIDIAFIYVYIFSTSPIHLYSLELLFSIILLIIMTHHF